MSDLKTVLENRTANHFMPFLWYAGEPPETLCRALESIRASGIRGVTIEDRGGDWFNTERWWALLERLFAAPQLEGLQLEADTCWIKQAGLDVMPYLEANAARIPLVHAKDLGTDNEVTEIGNGVIDFRPVVEFARRRGIPWVIYEQDATKGTELESTLTSLRNLKAAAGA